MPMVLGIDPGISGGLAIAGIPLALPMPHDLASVIRSLAPSLAIVERVHAMPGQGVTSMFTFGQGYGRILGTLEALGIPYVTVSPQRWQKAVLGQLPGKAGKRLAVEWCKAKWPSLDLKASKRCRVEHDGMCDALAISTYGYEAYSWLL